MMVSAKKLIQGSVIYMKKMRVSKRGFTLTEIIIVVAIMVIVASAAFVGVAVTLENARKNSDEVNRRHGVGEDGKDLFEAQAWEEIDELTKDAANFFDVTLYKPAKPTNTPTPTPTPTTVPVNTGTTETSKETEGTTTTSEETEATTTTTISSGGGPQTNLKDLPDSTVKTDNWGRNVVIANTPLPNGWSSQGYKKVEIVIECDGNIEGFNGVDNCVETHSGKTVTLTVTDPNQTNIGARIYTSSGSAKVVSIKGY